MGKQGRYKGWRYAAVIPSVPIRVASVLYTGTGLSVPVYRNPLKGQNSLSLSLSVFLSHTHAHACTCTHTHTRTRTHTHTLCTPPPPSPPSDVSFSLLLPTRHLVFLPSLSLCLSLLPICPWQRNKEPSKPGVEVKLLTVAIDIRRERERANHCNIVYSGIPVQNTGSGVNTGKNTGTVIRTGTQP